MQFLKAIFMFTTYQNVFPHNFIALRVAYPKIKNNNLHILLPPLWFVLTVDS